MDCTGHGILQARILEWAAFRFSRGSSQPRDGTQVSCFTGGFFTSWATREAPTAHYQKSNQPSRKTGKNLNGYFSKEGTQMSIKHMTRCSGPLLQKCQSNCNQVPLTPSEEPSSKRSPRMKCCRGQGKQGLLLPCGRGWKPGRGGGGGGCSHKRKQYGDSLEH